MNNQSLYIVDSSQLKVSEFHIENDLGELTHIDDFLYPDRAFRRVVNFWPYDDDNYLFVFGEGFSAQDLREAKFERVELFNKITQEYTEVYKLPQREYFKFSNDRGFGVRPLAFGTKPIFSKENGELYYGHNSDPKIFHLDFESPENSTQVFEMPIEPVQVSSQERQSILDDEYYVNRNLQNEIREQLPKVKPLFENFLIDDDGHFWVAVNHANFQNGKLWWIFSSDGERLYQTKLKDSVIFHEIKNGKAYGVKESEFGVQSLISFSVNK